MRTSGVAVSVLLVVVIALFDDVSGAATFPKTWKRCKQTDPELNKCLSVAVFDAVQKMEKKGVPSLGLFPIDPLNVDHMEIIQGDNGPITLNLDFKHLQISGIAKSSITDYKANLKKYTLYTKSETPSFTLTGDYSMDGRILLLPIQGKGKCNVTLKELVTDHFLTGELFNTDGKEYMKIKDYRITLKAKRVTYHFDNLFNGNKQLGDTMNRFMNDNWAEIFTELRPTLEQTFAAMFKEMSNRIFTKLPFDEIFLP